MNERIPAKTKLDQFLAHNTILEAKGKLPIKGKATPESKKYLINNLNLISTLASLKHSLEMSPVDLYIMYTENIQEVFGEDSLETSNCFFMMGHYYYD